MTETAFAIRESEQPAATPASAAADHPILARARRRAAEQGLPYAGGVTPYEAWQLISAHEAALVDVRSAEERKFVGRVPQSLHVAWATGLDLVRNPRFVDELEAAVPKDAPILFLCRSGRRSISAAVAATRAGYRHAYNIAEGFEGDLDGQGRRGRSNGWRFRGLPWQQE